MKCVHHSKEEDVREAPFSVVFKRKSQRFFSFQYIQDKLVELIGVEINQNFISDDAKTKEYSQRFDINKILYSQDLKDKIFDGKYTLEHIFNFISLHLPRISKRLKRILNVSHYMNIYGI